MEWIYKYISWGAIIAGSIGSVGFFIKYLIQKKIDSYFDKQLENHKKELAVLTENAKYDISKKLFDFEAYASKKHTVYPELYSQVFELWSELSRFSHKFDMDINLSKRDLDNMKLDKLFYNKLTPIMDKYSDAYDYFYKNELYLSKNIAILYEDAIRAQENFIQKMTQNFYRNQENDNWKDLSFNLINLDDEDFEIAEEKIQMLKETIYKELSYTHFEEAEKKEEALS